MPSKAGQIFSLVKRTFTGPRIGVVSSFDCRGDLSAGFEAGLSRTYGSAVTPKYPDGNGPPSAAYNTLDHQVTYYVQNGYDLIVTVGGVIAYDSANRTSSKPFFSLLGAAPENPSGFFQGGVDLQMYSTHDARIKHLTDDLHYNASQIYLFFNENSKTKDDEKNKWKAGNPKAGAGPGPNDTSKFHNTFQGITGKAAVVFSADPFFYSKREDLIREANTWVRNGQRHVIYPLKEYANQNGTNQPDPTVSILHGPSLYDGYFVLGQLVGDYLKQAPSWPTLILLPIGDPVPVGS
jgi:hypothetical protein